MFKGAYSERRVLVTGHTGFKGSWLSAWLLDLGARVAGYSIDIPTRPSHFQALQLEKNMEHYTGDIRDRAALEKVFQSFQPEVVFHLAAQPIVRRSFLDPVTTFEVNAMGTLNLLECLRRAPDVRAAVLITSDKCYRNVEWEWGYRENDTLGGEDPYSGSKACAELIFYSYYHSYFNHSASQNTAIATARAGNVIGGGDWAPDRIIPDCVRAWSQGDSVTIRNPKATRPWQHVLEPLSGYLWLGAYLQDGNALAKGNSYNFGPDGSVNHSVETIIRMLGEFWPGAKWETGGVATDERKESRLLKLSCDKALADLNWQATLSLADTVRMTSDWYRRFYSDQTKGALPSTIEQIREYGNRAKEKQLAWTI